MLKFLEERIRKVETIACVELGYALNNDEIYFRPNVCQW